MVRKKSVTNIRALLKDLIAISRQYGADPMHVIAGGGNTSIKKGNALWIKASGKSMATIGPDGFLELDKERVLSTLTRKDWSKNREEREDQIAKVLLDSRRNPPDPDTRPSVESTLHALMPQTFVLHTHGELANGLTCSKMGEDGLKKIALPAKVKPVWMRYVDPGLPLAQELERVLKQYVEEHGEYPNTVFMAKHGILVAAETAEGADSLMKACDRALKTFIQKKRGVPKKPKVAVDSVYERAMLPAIRSLLPEPTWIFRRILEPALDRHFSKGLSQVPSLLPDETVYCGAFPVWIPAPKSMEPRDVREAVEKSLSKYLDRYGKPPVVFFAEGLGAYAAGPTQKDVTNTADMFASAMRMYENTLAFGGPNPLTKREWTFIDNWSVEKYRRKQAAGSSAAGRASGKVILVTGAAQGVGKEIAEGLAAEGARLVLADLNPATLNPTVESLTETYGPGVAVGGVCNVTSEEDLDRMVALAISTFGGLDAAISNAGILKAFKVTDFPADTWRAIVDVNLAGYFLTAKCAAKAMRYQHSGNIIQINSKSGKMGSKYNSAYAASKFGGIGLTQSLALDLIEDGVRVNAICPGNFLDLPLWSAPGGLFDQYRPKFGNVSREEVRKIYEGKVPMGRGCQVSDVVKTILYILEQGYETGQAYNVTGGQEMR
ncbi:MAG: SDR family NAD(P)-dependent oxidoreductase [Candidatus Omnitrophica bacterium]|nr:SDR family NAD(P)-dependent oxidoreductase [Candidatus Omnitrophota bacterium]